MEKEKYTKEICFLNNKYGSYQYLYRLLSNKAYPLSVNGHQIYSFSSASATTSCTSTVCTGPAWYITHLTGQRIFKATNQINNYSVQISESFLCNVWPDIIMLKQHVKNFLVIHKETSLIDTCVRFFTMCTNIVCCSIMNLYNIDQG